MSNITFSFGKKLEKLYIDDQPIEMAKEDIKKSISVFGRLEVHKPDFVPYPY